MCAFGPKQTFQSLRSTSAFGGKARSRVRRSQRQACCCLLAVQIEREAAEADHRTSPGRSAASEDRRRSRCRHRPCSEPCSDENRFPCCIPDDRVVHLGKRPLKRWIHLLGQAMLLIISWGLIFEIGLRLQQYFGPLYDLDMASVSLNGLSDVLNHKPGSGKRLLDGRSIFGDLDGFTFKTSYDDNGVRIINDKELLAGCRNPV